MNMRPWIMCAVAATIPLPAWAESNQLHEFTFNSPVGYSRGGPEGKGEVVFRPADGRGQIMLRAMKRSELPGDQLFERLVTRFATKFEQTSKKVVRLKTKRAGSDPLPRIVGGLAYMKAGQGAWVLDLVLVTPPGEKVEWLLISSQFPKEQAPSWRTHVGSIIASLQNVRTGRPGRAPAGEPSSGASPANPLPASTAVSQPSTPEVTGPPGFVLVPAGEFTMGTSERLDNGKLRPVADHTPHVVSLDAFWIGQHEVTRGEWKRFMGETGREPPFAWDDPVLGASDDLPVVNVTWQEAQDFCHWAGGRLPTEAEWEKAARGGVEGEELPFELPATTEDPIPYAADTLQAVGSYSENGYGLYDTVANASEWCSDWYEVSAYEAHAPRNPTGPAKGATKILRGGSYTSWGANFRRSWSRDHQTPTVPRNDIGFRMVIPHEEWLTRQGPGTKSLAISTPSAPVTGGSPRAAPSPSAGAEPPGPEGFVLVPAGSFVMGSAERIDNANVIELKDHRPHEVELSAFWIGSTEVTIAQWRKYLAATGKPPPGVWENPNLSADEQLPVVHVSWQEAQDYCHWMGGRLPTEAEWEKAARGGEDGAHFPFEIPADWEEAPYSRKELVPVGSFAPNGYGLHDTVGNVEEWCSDWFDVKAYETHAPRDPTGPPEGTEKVTRGGSFHESGGHGAENWARNRFTPGTAHDFLGFRVVIPASDWRKNREKKAASASPSPSPGSSVAPSPSPATPASPVASASPSPAH